MHGHLNVKYKMNFRGVGTCLLNIKVAWHHTRSLLHYCATQKEDRQSTSSVLISNVCLFSNFI